MHTQNIEQTVAKLKALPPERIMEVDDFIDFLHQRRDVKSVKTLHKPLDFPVDNMGPWPEGLSLRREELYGDDGR